MDLFNCKHCGSKNTTFLDDSTDCSSGEYKMRCENCGKIFKYKIDKNEATNSQEENEISSSGSKIRCAICGEELGIFRVKSSTTDGRYVWVCSSCASTGGTLKEEFATYTESKGNGNGLPIIMGIIVLLFIFALLFSPDSSSSSSKTIECQVCDRSFNVGSENAKSISRSNMCSNCYSNFKWGQKVIEGLNNMPVD